MPPRGRAPRSSPGSGRVTIRSDWRRAPVLRQRMTWLLAHNSIRESVAASLLHAKPALRAAPAHRGSHLLYGAAAGSERAAQREKWVDHAVVTGRSHFHA